MEPYYHDASLATGICTPGPNGLGCNNASMVQFDDQEAVLLGIGVTWLPNAIYTGAGATHHVNAFMTPTKTPAGNGGTSMPSNNRTALADVCLNTTNINEHGFSGASSGMHAPGCDLVGMRASPPDSLCSTATLADFDFDAAGPGWGLPHEDPRRHSAPAWHQGTSMYAQGLAPETLHPARPFSCPPSHLHAAPARHDAPWHQMEQPSMGQQQHQPQLRLPEQPQHGSTFAQGYSLQQGPTYPAAANLHAPSSAFEAELQMFPQHVLPAHHHLMAHGSCIGAADAAGPLLHSRGMAMGRSGLETATDKYRNQRQAMMRTPPIGRRKRPATPLRSPFPPRVPKRKRSARLQGPRQDFWTSDGTAPSEEDPESSDKDYKADTEEEAEEDDTSDSDYEGEACVSQKRKAGKGAGSKKRRKGDPPMPPLPQEHFFVREGNRSPGMVRAAKSIYHFMLTQAQAGKNLLPERHIRTRPGARDNQDQGKALRMMFGDGFVKRHGKRGGKSSCFLWELATPEDKPGETPETFY